MIGSLGAGGGYSLQMSSAAESALSDRSPINIAPIGFNLGEILQPINQGSPENGGVGADFMQRYAGGITGRTAKDVGKTPWLLYTGVGLIGLTILYMVAR